MTDYCCTPDSGDCCGPGSWCCGRAGKHDHEERTMTTLYKPVLIESAEQAEALPDGAVLVREDHFAFQKHAGHFVSADPHDLPTGAAWEVVGWTALVPIEAEEEKRSVARHSGGGQTNYNTEAADNPGRMGEYIASLPVESRLVTPWESA